MPLDFNGTTQAANMGTDIPSLNGKAAATIMFWVFADSTATDRDIVNLAIGPPPGTTGTSRASFNMDAGGQGEASGRSSDADALQSLFTAAGYITTGTWIHCAAVLDVTGDTITVYKNGVLNTSGAVAWAAATYAATNSKNGAFAANDLGTGAFFDGQLDDVRIYSRVLTASQIATIFATRGTDGIVDNLEQRYLCKDAAPGVASGVGTIKDVANQKRNCDGTAGPPYTTGILRFRKKCA